MKPAYTFQVSPKIPKKLSRLVDVAHNLVWAWDFNSIDLFRRLDPGLWEQSGHNPVRMLGMIDQRKLQAAQASEGVLSHYGRVCERLDEYASAETWCQRFFGGMPELSEAGEMKIAYFSAEFGLTECLRIYSGGLGMLAGEHLKSSSDLGLPLIGVGLCYQQGYFSQYLNADGWQQENYPENDFYNLPIQTVLNDAGAPVTVDVPYPGRLVRARVWKAQVGRVPLYLLDTNVEENGPEDRKITGQLYGGDQETRIRQEILLGMGGVQALLAMNVTPTICHMNEGHSAFSAVQRILNCMERYGVDFDVASEIIRGGSVFTTHTPVPAGNDVFPAETIDQYFRHLYPRLGVSRERFLGLGRQNPNDHSEGFCMTVLAMRLAAFTNGVSGLHGEVSRKMWRSSWPGLPHAEIPIGSITNGIHTRTWISKEMESLLERYLGPSWMDDPTDREVWNRVDDIPAEELWRTHERRRERLIAFARKSLQAQLRRRGAPAVEVERAAEVLNSNALTIGFARRFATYKRATLIFRDLNRLKDIVQNAERPVQFIFAGKAHPRDHAGKELIREIVHQSRLHAFRDRIVFVENYSIDIARYLVQGVDVWLNNPQRPLEASGTSGMKVIPNGGLNLSVLDGWWCEGYAPEVGWAIGQGEEYQDPNEGIEIESEAMYDLIEKEIAPLFYDRGADDIPRGWVKRMKESVKRLCPVYNTHRMVFEYTENFYIPCALRKRRLLIGDCKGARELAEWKKKVFGRWDNLSIGAIRAHDGAKFVVGGSLKVEAEVFLADLDPSDLLVECYAGPIDASGVIENGEAVVMRPNGESREDRRVFACEIPFQEAGRFGFTIRVLPSNEWMMTPHEAHLVKWV